MLLLQQAWLEQHGPVHALVDGANVALFGQNWEHGAFSWGQIKGVMDHLTCHHPDLHPLMVNVMRTAGVVLDIPTHTMRLTPPQPAPPLVHVTFFLFFFSFSFLHVTLATKAKVSTIIIPQSGVNVDRLTIPCD